MQIHELNNYSGSLGASSYVAVDNGDDTGKVSTNQLLGPVQSEVHSLDVSLNARIDNIIAGGTAPSEAEIVDARQGADGVTYSSLGAAIRGQVEDLMNCDGQVADSVSNSTAALHNYRIVSGASVTELGNGYQITNATAFAGIFFRLAVVPNSRYKVVFDGTVTSGRIFASAVSLDRSVQLKTFNVYTTTSNLCMEFDSGDYSNVLIGFQNANANGNISVTNIKILIDGQLSDLRDNVLGLITPNILAPYSGNYLTGHYYNYSTGNMSDNANYSATPFVMLKESTRYTLENATGAHIAFYDDTYTYISGTLSTTFTTPSGCAYAHISIKTSEISGAVLREVASGVSYGNTVTVAKSGGDFSTIQAAVDATTDADTILVFPGLYEEIVIVPDGGGRNIIGLDRENCIIKTTSGKYAECPLKIYGNFHIENLTLIATAEDAGGWSPTWQPGDNTTFASYALHVDGSASANNGKKGFVRNCTLYSECSHALGAGAQVGYTLTIENCEIVRNTTDSDYLNSSYEGAMGCHSPNTNVSDTGELFIMRDCTVVNKGQTKALQLYKVYNTSPFEAEIKGCTFRDSAGIDNVIKFQNTTDAMITDMSHGNSTDEVNYRAIHA